MSITPSDQPETSPAKLESPESTGIQTPPSLPASCDVTALPPLPTPREPVIDTAHFLQQCGRLDVVLIALVLAFAFLVAFFPVANPDFFRQIATGRLLLEGGYQFGSDPFVYTEDGAYWVNHSWLFAVLAYVLYQINASGVVIVIVKALLVAAVAELMLRAGRRIGQSLWIPAACTALAILTASPRLYFQSTCLSFLFLALTLWLLHRPYLRSSEDTAAAGETSFRSWWLLPALFVLWVNCDAWFILGPLTVALYLAGELIQQRLPTDLRSAHAAQPKEIGKLGLVLLVGLVACLLNPHHVHAFTLPVELGLSPAGDRLIGDSQYAALFISPLSKAYYQQNMGLSVAGMAYLPLLIVGIASFGVLYRRLPLGRLLVWLGFALLSLYNMRAIPFFAIVAGPITALNWLDFAAQQFGRAPLVTHGWRIWSLAGRGLTILLALTLLFLSVPGWLQAQPRDYRRVGWTIHVDPSLKEAALAIQKWRQENRLPAEAHWFNLDQEVSHYLAWFAPGEQVFLDPNLPYFPPAAGDYLAILEGLKLSGRELNPSAEDETSSARSDPRKDWRKTLRARRVHYWIFDNRSSRPENLTAQTILFANPDEWVECYLQGKIAIFAWRDPQAKDAPDPSKNLPFDLKSVAFGADAEQAPPQGPRPPGTPQEGWDAWWQESLDAWWHPGLPSYLERETAALLESRQEARKQYLLTQNAQSWQGATLASLVTFSMPTGPMPRALLPLSWTCIYSQIAHKHEQAALAALRVFVLSHDDGLPESAYLQLRAARRSLLDHADDSLTYSLLAHAYRELGNQLAERSARTMAPKLAEIRRTQIVAALHSCLRTQPNARNTLEAHLMLFGAYEPLGYVDVQKTHLREVVELTQKMGTPVGVDAEEFNQMLKKYSEELVRRENEVNKRQELYGLAASNRSALEKIHLALDKGLAETAWSDFRQLDPEELKSGLGQFTVRRMVEVLLNLGWLDEASTLLTPASEKSASEPVAPDNMDLHLRLAAARGDYAEADRLLADALNYAWPGANKANQENIGRRVGKVLLVEATRLAGVPRLPWVPNDLRLTIPPNASGEAPGQSPSDFWVRRWQFEALTNGLSTQQRRSEWHMLRGWLALEAGRCIEAGKYFQSALNELPEEKWIVQSLRLNAFLVETPGQMAPEHRFLENMLLQQRFIRGFARHHLRWLEVYQQKKELPVKNKP